MRAGIYVRVSTGEGMQLDGFSLDAQQRECRKLAASRGWEVVATYREEGVSAKTMKRPQFRRMMRDARTGLFDVIIVHKLDRFSRSVVDILTTLKELERLGVSFVSATEQIDFTTPIGRATLTMMAVFAEWYLNNLSVETAKGKKARAENGFWNSAVPFGYTVDYKKDGGDGLAYPDELAFEGAQLAFEWCATSHYSDLEVARKLNEAGYRPNGRGDRALRLFSKDTVRDMLQNRFYLGEVQYKGEWYEGVHEPIISEDLFERAQAARATRRYSRGISAPKSSRVYPLSGIARCARCGGRLRGSFASGRRYYRDPARDRACECDQKMIRADKAEEALGDFLEKLVLPSDWKARVLEMIQGKVVDVQEIERERRRLGGQLDRLKRLFMLGDIEEREYRAERDRLKAKLAALKIPEMPDLERAAALLRDFGVIWDAATDQERKKILRTLLESVYLDSGECGPVMAIEPKAEFFPLFEAAESNSVEGNGKSGGIIILSPGAELVEWQMADSISPQADSDLA